jgi:hypothetical protein
MKSQTLEIFPTIIKRYDISDQITGSEIESMISDIDDIHENHIELMQIDDLTVRHQCKPILFHEKYPYVQKTYWKKLADTFIACAEDYNRTVTELVPNQNSMMLTGIRAWFYKSCRKTWTEYPSRPEHNHRPSYLSGVFNLRIPGDLTTGGTEFCDPRGPGMRNMRNVTLQPIPLTWIIFPGWLDHSAGRVDSDEWRYTIAADSYVKII